VILFVCEMPVAQTCQVKPLRVIHDEVTSPRKQGRFWRLLWPITHYLVTNLTVTIGYVFFHFLNRTTVIGKENVPRRPNTLLLCNHQTMIDSFLVGLCAYYPASFLRPSLIPWNPAAEENFFRTRILAWLADNWKCIPIRRGRKDVGAIFRMAEALRTSPMTLFPEGTRSRDGSVGRARGGAGLLILETRPTVIPVCIDGMDKVLPVGSILPRFFKRVYVMYGRPLDLSEFYGRQKSKEVAQAIMDRVMEAIRELCEEIQRRKQAKR
jgi:1-acyl-sn-glycerol-3-phosphate acyltransferase